MDLVLWLACLAAAAVAEPVEIPVEITAEIGTASGKIEKFQQIINFRVDPQSEIIDPAKTPDVINRPYNDSNGETGAAAAARCVKQSDHNGDGTIDKVEMESFVMCITVAMSAVKTSTQQPPSPDVNTEIEHDTQSTTIAIEKQPKMEIYSSPPPLQQNHHDAAKPQGIQEILNAILGGEGEKSVAEEEDNAMEDGRRLCLHAFCKNGTNVQPNCEQTPFFTSCMRGVAGGYGMSGDSSANVTQIQCGIAADRNHSGNIPTQAIAEFMRCIKMLNNITTNAQRNASAEDEAEDKEREFERLLTEKHNVLQMKHKNIEMQHEQIDKALAVHQKHAADEKARLHQEKKDLLHRHQEDILETMTNKAGVGAAPLEQEDTSVPNALEQAVLEALTKMDQSDEKPNDNEAEGTSVPAQIASVEVKKDAGPAREGEGEQ